MKRKIAIFMSAATAVLACAVSLTACGDDDDLRFTLSDDGTYYICEAARAADPTITEIEIPTVYEGKPVAEIGHFGFIGLKSITIPDSVITIGKDAFSGCVSLENVTIGSGVKTIERFAFGGCTALESITIPDSVTEMGEVVFEQCHNLKTVSFGAGITTIPEYTFFLCENLGNIDLPDTVKIIGENAFRESGLKGITMNGVTAIGGYAFNGCDNLKNVTVPDSVTSIGERAFGNCGNLESALFNGKNKIELSEAQVFADCPNLKSIFVGHKEYWGGVGNLSPANLYFYSYNEPSDDDFLYWHYVDGEAVIWESHS